MTKGKLVGWHHRLDRHEFEQAPGDGEGQEGLACCSPWGHTELHITERLNNNGSVHHSINQRPYKLGLGVKSASMSL